MKKRAKPSKASRPYALLTPSDIKRLAELKEGGKYAEFKKCHFCALFERSGFAPISFSMYGTTFADIEQKALDTLNTLNSAVVSKDGKEKWKIAHLEDCSRFAQNDSLQDDQLH